MNLVLPATMEDHHVVEFIFAGAMIAQGICVWLWIKSYHYTYRQLAKRHPEKHARLWGSAERRKNGMDRLFALVQFALASEDRSLKDAALSRGCLLLKAIPLAFFLFFLAMSFSPMFLPAGQ